ncbi:MAG: SMC family ATPase [Armatimonadetes bacterium]|nr:SMC family ATPase [Armatimonadota bacterium]
MKLIALEMENFRQHVHASIQFSDGVTGVVGPNGAGKTTLLEAVAWALYGLPALREGYDTVRTRGTQGGCSASVTLTFELTGSVYAVSRKLEASGKPGSNGKLRYAASALLEVDGRPISSGTSEVSDAVARLLAMDYQAFFTSFFTGQKQLEFMSQLEGRARAAAISKMLGYDRITKARDQANSDRLGLAREIEGLEKGLADQEELKERKKTAKDRLSTANAALAESEKSHAGAEKIVEELKPVKEASDQKAKRFDALSRSLDMDRAEIKRVESRLAQLRQELDDLGSKEKELASLAPNLERYRQAGEEFKKQRALQEHEGRRRELLGGISALRKDIEAAQSRIKQLAPASDAKMRADAALSEAERLLAAADEAIRLVREKKVGLEHHARAEASHLESRLKEIKARREAIADAGTEGKCPTCERPLASELPVVLGNFDDQISDIASRIDSLARQAKSDSDAVSADLQSKQSDRDKLAAQVESFRNDKLKADASVAERDSLASQVNEKIGQLAELDGALSGLPTGFDQKLFSELQRIGDELRPVREKGVGLRTALERKPVVESEIAELDASSASRLAAISLSEKELAEIEFNPEAHAKLARDFEAASSAANAAHLSLERQRGEVKTAEAILTAAEREEEAYKSKMEQLKEKRAERLHLQTVAEALDKLRADLNDRIKPELESLTGELLSTMTDGRYNVVSVDDNYQATIIDDNERKPVVSGGEEDVLNLALRLAVSQMIADRAGQSFSLLILDEVFGSLDETRRDNVVALLQNLKNRFEQIILITHIESIHDAVDNCLWVGFDERTKTSRLIDRSEQFAESMAGAL